MFIENAKFILEREMSFIECKKYINYIKLYKAKKNAFRSLKVIESNQILFFKNKF